MKKIVSDRFMDHMAVISNALTEEMLDDIVRVAEVLKYALKNENKVLFCGNGGSAADAQHFAAEMVGRFQKERKGLAGIALTTDTSILTAVSNDYDYNNVFARQVEAIGKNGDILFGISTSGNSENIIKAVEKAKEMDLVSIGLLGGTGGVLKEKCDYSIVVPGKVTARIQEVHILIEHILCELIDGE